MASALSTYITWGVSIITVGMSAKIAVTAFQELVNEQSSWATTFQKLKKKLFAAVVGITYLSMVAWLKRFF